MAIFAVIGLTIFGGYHLRQREIAQAGRRASALPPTSSSVDAEVEDAESTSSSYAVVRQSLNERMLPSKDSVRIEEIINYFPYDYPEPTRNELVSLNVEIATCPWADSHRLVRIGLKARKKAMSQADAAEVSPRPIQIAGEVKIGVEFSPAEVDSYRLIGYEKQAADKQNTHHIEIDIGDMATGRAVTVLFEVVPPVQSCSECARGRFIERTV